MIDVRRLRRSLNFRGVRAQHAIDNSHVLALVGSHQFEYSYTHAGPIGQLGDNGHLQSDVGVNDEIIDNGDGTFTVNGRTGTSDTNVNNLFIGDSYELSGDLLDLTVTPLQDTGSVEIFVDGKLVTAQEAVNIITPTQPDCGTDTDCGANQACVDGHCLDIPEREPECSTDSGCGAGEVCVDGVCVVQPECDPECIGDDECSGDGECINGVCVTPPACQPECSGDSHCATGEICHDGMCITEPEPPACQPECSSNGECASGEICHDGMCISDPGDDGIVEAGTAGLLLIVAIVAYLFT